MLFVVATIMLLGVIILKDKSIIVNLINALLFGLTINLISYINNIFATITITFVLTNIIVIINDVLETQLLHKENKLVIAISQIKAMKDKTEKAANIIELFYPAIFTTLLAFVIHSLYLIIKYRF